MISIRISIGLMLLLSLNSCSMTAAMYNRHPVFGSVLFVVLVLVIAGIYFGLRKVQNKENKD